MSVGNNLVSFIRKLLTSLMLLCAILLFAVGVSVPFFDVQKFWLFTDEVSVLSGLVELARASEWFLFVIIFLFTIVFPLVKLTALGVVWWMRGSDDERADLLLRWVSQLGKWSMLDVFVVAILVVTIKSSSVARISVDLGVYLFTASVIMTQITSFRLERRLFASTQST